MDFRDFFVDDIRTALVKSVDNVRNGFFVSGDEF